MMGAVVSDRPIKCIDPGLAWLQRDMLHIVQSPAGRGLVVTPVSRTVPASE